MTIPPLVSHVPLMCIFTQEGHGIRDLLCITASHEGEVVTHQGCPRVNILRAAPIEAGWLLGLPGHCRKHLELYICTRLLRQLRKIHSFPPMIRGTPTDTSDPAIASGRDFAEKLPTVATADSE